MIAVVLAMAIFAGVWIIKSIRDDNLAALEALDDETLAAEAAQAWNQGERA